MKRDGREVAQEAAAEATTEDLDAAKAEGGAAEASGEGVEAGPGEDLLELVLAEHAARAAPEAPAKADARIDGVVIGRLLGIGASGDPLVDFAGSPSGGGIAARAAAPLGEGDVGRRVALMFEGGSARKPIVMGLIHEPMSVSAETPEEEAPTEASGVEGAEARVDGDRVVLSAEKEIVLQCGKASITLTRAGKILIRGAYLLARSSGVNRIQGGSVQIN